MVQWGSKDEFQEPEMRERAKKALVQYVKRFEERNPHLRLIGAYIHMDDASTYLPRDYVPLAYGYCRGLWTRYLLTRHRKNMGR
ncbi:hypothetical protein BGU93_18790, partial [Clostridioides difficile]